MKSIKGFNQIRKSCDANKVFESQDKTNLSQLNCKAEKREISQKSKEIQER